MARTRFAFLEKDEEELIHRKTLEMLEKIGVLVRSDSVLRLLDENGARADYSKKIAYLPESMVLEAVSSAPKIFHLCARDKKNDIELPSPGLPYLTTDGLMVYIRDIDGKKREAGRRDFAQFAKLAEALDSISFFWPIVTISDVPPEMHNLYELWDSFISCSLHVQGDCIRLEDARRQIKVASLVAGGAEELRKRPLFSTAVDPIAPLSFDGGALEGQVELARAGVPILCQSMCLAGMSSPVTLAGTIAVINAENLASLVITQAASKGAPQIYASSSTPADMATGNINYLAPEFLMISAGVGQMARRYRRPCMISNWGAGMKGEGISSSYSEMFAYMSTIMTGGDLVPGIGGLDGAMGCSLAQMIIDSELWDNFKAFLRTFSVSEETIALDVIREVGHGNSFLNHRHTGKNFRKELFFWDAEKLARETTLSDRMVPRARETAKRMLAEHVVEPLDRSIASEGEALMKEYAKGY